MPTTAVRTAVSDARSDLTSAYNCARASEHYVEQDCGDGLYLCCSRLTMRPLSRAVRKRVWLFVQRRRLLDLPRMLQRQ